MMIEIKIMTMENNKFGNTSKAALACKIAKIVCISFAIIGVVFFFYYQLDVINKDIRGGVSIIGVIFLLQLFYYLFKRDFSAARIKAMVIEITIVLVLLFF